MAIAPATGRTDPYVADRRRPGIRGLRDFMGSHHRRRLRGGGDLAAAVRTRSGSWLCLGLAVVRRGRIGRPRSRWPPAVWLIIIQWLSSGLGGYLTGRLRTKWVGVHTHEVFFRDTAHGFLTWAVASVVVAGLPGLLDLVGGERRGAHRRQRGVRRGSRARRRVRHRHRRAARPDISWTRCSAPISPTPTLRRRRPGRGHADSGERRRQRHGRPGRPHLLAKLVAARTGLSQADAEKRVDDVMAQEKAAEAKVRAGGGHSPQGGGSCPSSPSSRCWSARSSPPSPARSAADSATNTDRVRADLFGLGQPKRKRPPVMAGVLLYAGWVGEPGGIRTHGPKIKSLVLYQLSYGLPARFERQAGRGPRAGRIAPSPRCGRSGVAIHRAHGGAVFRSLRTTRCRRRPRSTPWRRPRPACG